jgi:hypothetical protein
MVRYHTWGIVALERAYHTKQVRYQSFVADGAIFYIWGRMWLNERKQTEPNVHTLPQTLKNLPVSRIFTASKKATFTNYADMAVIGRAPVDFWRLCSKQKDCLPSKRRFKAAERDSKGYDPAISPAEYPGISYPATGCVEHQF